MIDNNLLEVTEKFATLSKREMKKALTKGLRAGLNAIKKQAVINLKSRVKGASKRNDRYNDTLASGIRLSKFKEDNNEIIGNVKISSKRNKGSGSFRLKFLENGSNSIRYVKKYRGKQLTKKASRGKLKGYYFFRDAQDTERFTEIMNKTIEEQLKTL